MPVYKRPVSDKNKKNDSILEYPKNDIQASPQASTHIYTCMYTHTHMYMNTYVHVHTKKEESYTLAQNFRRLHCKINEFIALGLRHYITVIRMSGRGITHYRATINSDKEE